MPIPSPAALAAFLASHGLPPGGRVAVACSGGADSLLLLDLAREALPGRVSCAHFDHRLRAGSAADAAFVRAWCQRQGVPYVGGRGDVAAAAKEAKRGIEETARALRYAFLDKARRKLGADSILTAHHLDDQAETLLLRLARGTKLTGLGGIPERNGTVLRPFLTFPKSTLLAAAKARGLIWREDPTNADPAFARNRVRRDVVPALEKVNPGVRDALGRLAAYARDLGSWMDAQLGALLREDPAAPGRGHFPLAPYLALPAAARGELLRAVFTRVTGSGDGLTEANLNDADRFLHGPGNPRTRSMFGVRLDKRGGTVAYGRVVQTRPGR